MRCSFQHSCTWFSIIELPPQVASRVVGLVYAEDVAAGSAACASKTKGTETRRAPVGQAG